MAKKNIYDSKTPNWQRVSIWIIAITMALGTLLTLFVSVFAGQNSNTDPAAIAQKKEQEKYEEYLKSDEYKKMLEQQEKAAAERLAKLRPLDGFADKVAVFNAGEITELKIEILTEGTGATVGEGDTISANYTGWTPDGKIFDSTKLDGADAAPASFSLAEVIKGWGNGLVGARAGGFYLLSIPADQAYGATGSGENIPPNTPLRFVVQVISVTKSS